MRPFSEVSIQFINSDQTVSVYSLECPQGVPDLIKLIVGTPQLTLELCHHTLMLIILTAVEELQILVLL